MRLTLALVGCVVFAVIALVTAGTRPPPASAGTAAGAQVAIPRVTADPSSFARVDPAADRGRAAEDRTEHRPAAVRGLRIPIEGAALPDDPALLPNAPRDYRGGYHEGIDFSAPPGTPVRAAAAGTIVRIDRDYVDWDAGGERIALLEAVQLGYTPAITLDRIRGRQVWIDHGGGVVTRYAHLSAVADRTVGDSVNAGDVIGAVGSSGFPEGGPHLHLEVRVGASYLGDGLAGDALLAAVSAAFE